MKSGMRLWLQAVLALLALSITIGCGWIDLVGFSQNIPMANGAKWSNFEMVTDLGSEGTWDVDNVWGGSVVKEGATYKMWYVGLGNGTSSMIYAESTDGKTWSGFTQCFTAGILPPYDDTVIGHPTVIKDGVVYKMWYTAIDASKYVILYCESINGTVWSAPQLAVDAGSQGIYDAANAWGPTVIKEDGEYRMWYAGTEAGGANYRILYCRSNDGLTWNGFQLIIDIGSEGTHDSGYANAPMVIKDAGKYRMWYAGTGSTVSDIKIIYCESTDGLTWDKFKLAVDKGSEGTYDTKFVTRPAVINDSGYGKMWYRGNDGSKSRIIYCESF